LLLALLKSKALVSKEILGKFWLESLTPRVPLGRMYENVSEIGNRNPFFVGQVK
jgi:hypothetical protein